MSTLESFTQYKKALPKARKPSQVMREMDEITGIQVELVEANIILNLIKDRTVSEKFLFTATL